MFFTMRLNTILDVLKINERQHHLVLKNRSWIIQKIFKQRMISIFNLKLRKKKMTFA